MVEGPLLASQIVPVATYLGPLGVPLDNLAICSGSQISQAQQYHNAMSSGWVCETPDIIAADDMYSLGYRHVTVVATNYAFGWISAGGFIARFTQLGGHIDKTIYPALTATDFSPYVSAIPRTTQATFTESLGTGAVDFTKAYAQYGLRGKIPLIGNTTTLDPKTFGPVQNVYACKVTNVNGTLENVPFKTWTAVPPWGTLSYSNWLSAFQTDSHGPPAG